ncbi:MAG: hypothetical protein Q4F02_02765 [Candidatus Saccharibacteria bacterium]|nr:hypothetical protein [Candidatus Saccharibacteria bacterium]
MHRRTTPKHTTLDREPIGPSMSDVLCMRIADELSNRLTAIENGETEAADHGTALADLARLVSDMTHHLPHSPELLRHMTLAFRGYDLLQNENHPATPTLLRTVQEIAPQLPPGDVYNTYRTAVLHPRLGQIGIIATATRLLDKSIKRHEAADQQRILEEQRAMIRRANENLQRPATTK